MSEGALPLDERIAGRLLSSSVSMDQPLPVYLLNLVASLRDKSHKGFPVKKVRS